jgi:integrase
MSRPPLPVGTYGKIRTDSLPWGGFRAITRYRDFDGTTRRVERVGRSVTAAENNLKKALRDRGRAALDGEITADTKVSAVAELWLRDLEDSDKAIRTKVTYLENWERHVRPAVGELRVRDMRFSRVDRIIRDLREHSGPGTAIHAKVVLSGILGLAVRHDAMDSNPMRELTPSRRGKNEKKSKVNLTEDGLVGLRKHLRASEDAVKFDLVDLVDVLSGLGCRIGELLALDWTKVDEKAGTLAIEGTVIRVPGKGLIVQSHTKSSAGMRTITIPAWVLATLLRRYESAAGEWVFPSTKGTLRDAENTRTRLRAVLKGTEWEGLHPHAFRRLVATRLDAKGLSAREIADYLGHERVSMTQDVYMARRVTGALAADAMENLGPIQNDG